MTQWITYRQPELADADRRGDVFLKRHPTLPHCSVRVYWQFVGREVPWRHSDLWRRGLSAIEND